MRFHGISVLALAIVVAGVSAFTATSATAQNISDRAQAPGNVAGVIFHPDGDCFEIWDNVDNGRRAKVSWNYYGVEDRVKSVYSSGGHSRRCVNLKEFPNQIKFRISGHDRWGQLHKSGILRYRTYGS